MANLIFNTLLAPHAASDRIFIETPDGRVVTYGEFVALTGLIADALWRSGVRPGDRVAAQVEKTPEALALTYACIRAGAAFLPLNTAYTAPEVGYFVADAEPRVLVCDPAAVERLTPIAGEARILTLDAKGQGSLAEMAAGGRANFAPVPRGPEDMAAILYTSGTTGRSKGAMQSHDALLSNALTLRDQWRFTAKDTLLHALPIFHTHGLWVAANVTLAAGSGMLFMPKFDLDTAMRLLPKATTMMGVPTFYTRLLSRPDFTREAAAHMRLFVSGSAPLLAETHREFEARTGQRILERYGMTETNMNTSNPYDGERRAGTVGFPLPGVALKITDPATGAEVAKGEIGVIEVRGRNVFSGYWRMPEKTAEDLRPNGWFITGDLGMIDPDGYVVIVGRAKDLIISGGFNVYPKEIEEAIDDLPGVVESAVIGVPHPDFGEAVVAVIHAAAPMTESGVLSALNERLAKFKQPKRVFFVDELPRNTMGKVQKAALRTAHAALFTRA